MVVASKLQWQIFCFKRVQGFELGAERSPLYDFIWNKVVSLKVSHFAWRVLNDMISIKANLESFNGMYLECGHIVLSIQLCSRRVTAIFYFLLQVFWKGVVWNFSVIEFFCHTYKLCCWLCSTILWRLHSFDKITRFSVLNLVDLYVIYLKGSQ